MAQSGYTPIVLFHSTTTGNVPTTSNLAVGELAINNTDGKLFYNTGSAIAVLAGAGGAGVAGGSNTQVQYNSSGSLAGSANMTFSGTALTLANDASISGLTVGKGGGSITTNTVFGAGGALGTNVSGTDLTAIGRGALSLNTASYNTALGRSTLENNSSGAGNTAAGYQALVNNTTASNNTAVGYQAGYSNTTAAEIVAVGKGALYSNTVGDTNTAVGFNALTLATGAENTALGNRAMQAHTTGVNNVAVGRLALAFNTTASNNTAVGYQSLYANTTGTANVAVGYLALQTNTTGVANVAIGAGYTGVSPTALSSNTTGSYNIAIGTGALYANTTSSSATAVGYQALYNATGGSSVAVGYQAGLAVTSGNGQTLVGIYAGGGITTGSDNTCIGEYAGNYTTPLTTGNGCGYFGAFAKPSAAGAQFEYVMGYNLAGRGNSTAYIQGAAYQVNNSSSWSVSSDRRLKKNIVDNTEGLDVISQIRVRNFEYRLPEEVTELDPSNAIQKEGVQLGVIAQELQEVCSDCVKVESTGVISVDSDNIFWHLVNAVKELNAKVEAQAVEIAQLKGK